MAGIVQWMERWQIPLYVAAIAVGGSVGWLAPAVAPALTLSINPALGLLLFATFLGVPLIHVGRAFLDIRFLGTVLIVNFVVVPVIVSAFPELLRATGLCSSVSYSCCSLRALTM